MAAQGSEDALEAQQLDLLPVLHTAAAIEAAAGAGTPLIAREVGQMLCAPHHTVGSGT